MPELVPNLAPEHSIILAVDTSSEAKAEELVTIARNAGAWIVKIGLEFMSAYGPSKSSELAADYGLDWVADAKLFDIPNTVARAVANYSKLSLPPKGITISTMSGIKSLEYAQYEAGSMGITMFGVTLLTSNEEVETQTYAKACPRRIVWRESRRAINSGIGGLVCSGQEVATVKKFKATRGLFTMIPGTRSMGEETHDQKRPVTPTEAVAAGADLLVIGREVTESKQPAVAYERIVADIGASKLALSGKKGR